MPSFKSQLGNQQNFWRTMQLGDFLRLACLSHSGLLYITCLFDLYDLSFFFLRPLRPSPRPVTDTVKPVILMVSSILPLLASALI